MWNVFTFSESFVNDVLSFYYKNDAEVQKDSELQKWISDIFEHGFHSQPGTGGLSDRFNLNNENMHILEP